MEPSCGPLPTPCQNNYYLQPSDLKNIMTTHRGKSLPNYFNIIILCCDSVFKDKNSINIAEEKI